MSLGAQLVGIWIGKPPYVDENGRPRPLPRLASTSAGVSFESLVASVSKDIRSRVVLDEWLRLGIATLNERDEVELSTGAFIPRAGFDEIVFYFGHNLHDHVSAAVHNLLGEGKPWLERSVHYDALSGESIDQLNQLSRRLGMESLQILNGKAMELEERDAATAGPRQRFTTFRQWRQAPANRIGLAIALWLATAGSLWSPVTTAVAPACLQAVSSPMDVLHQGGLGGVEEIANDGSGAGMPAGGGNAAALAIFRGCPCAQPPVCRLARPRF